MDSPETVTSSEREEAKRVALDPATQETVTAVAEAIIEEALPPQERAPEVEYARPRHILDVLEVYEYGRGFLTRKHWPRWRESFALGVSADGIYCGRLGGNLGLLGVFWRTHNPVVDLNLALPEPHRDGTFVYVCWLWNDFGDDGVQALRKHLERTQLGARYVAHHDQRPKAKKQGRLITVPLGGGVDDAVVERILAERNGHGR